MYVLRAHGYSYENGQEVREKCWVTRDGGVSTNRLQAMVYKTEADAIDHGMAAGIIDEDYWWEIEEV